MTSFATEIPGPATVLRLTLDVEELDFSFRPVGLRWQHDPSAVPLTRMLTNAELAELVDKLASAIERLSGPLGPSTRTFTVVGDDNVCPLVLLAGGRSSLDGPYPVHLQLAQVRGATVTRLLTAAEAAELLYMLTRLRAAAPRTVADSLAAPRSWDRLEPEPPRGAGTRPTGDDPEEWARYAAAAPSREEHQERLVEALGAGVAPADMSGMSPEQMTETIAAAEAAAARGPLLVTRDFLEGNVVGSMLILMRLAQDEPSDLTAWIELMHRELAEQADRAGMTEHDLQQLLARVFAGEQPDG